MKYLINYNKRSEHKLKDFKCTVCGKEKKIKSYIGRQLYCSTECRDFENAIKTNKNRLRKSSKTEETKTFPKIRMELCGHIVQLHFDPRVPKYRMSLKHVRCQQKKCRSKKEEDYK